MPRLLTILQIAPPRELGAEETLIALVGWLRLAIEAMGAAVIAIGVVLSVVGFVRALIGHDRGEFIPSG
jgi:hypothetical protein